MNDDPTTAGPPSPDSTSAPIESHGVERAEPSEDQVDTDSAPADRLPADGSAESNEPLASTTSEISRESSCEAALPTGNEREPTQLDPRWIRLGRRVSLATVVVLGAVAAVICLWWFSSITAPWNLLIPAAWILLAISGVAAAIILPKLSYQHWSYQLGDRVIQLRHGIIWRVTLAIPLSRLQHVDLHRGPIERRLGLSSLEIHTAGTRAASHVIPGLSDKTAIALRDQLIDAANRGAHVVTRD